VPDLVVTYPDDGVAARVRLLTTEAPRTCAAILAALPLVGEALHAAYSGTEVALLIDPAIAIEEENATTCIQIGDVMYTHYHPGVRHGNPEQLSAVFWAYDRYVRPMTTGQWVPAMSNIFGQIIGDAAAFYDACRRMRREGAKQVEIRVAS
jgi:hypothetical protein